MEYVNENNQKYFQKNQKMFNISNKNEHSKVHFELLSDDMSLKT